MVKNLTVFIPDKFVLTGIEIHKVVNRVIKILNLQFSHLEISFITDGKIREINKQFLQHDYATDILTFSYNSENEYLDIELLISYETALKNSKKFNVSLKNELFRLMIHGFLHAMGVNDSTPREKRSMRKKEYEILNQINDYIPVN